MTSTKSFRPRNATRRVAEIRLLRRAESDLIAIAEYTVAQFGTMQAHSYRDGLLATLDALAEHPLMGSNQGHIRPGLRRHVYESHTIYYRPTANGVVIQRILGPGQDPLREL